MSHVELPTHEDMAGAAALAELAEWTTGQTYCMACMLHHRQAEYMFFGLQNHHLVKRSRRLCHLPWNVLRLCSRCHDLAEGLTIRVDGVPLPKLSLGACLEIKRTIDPGCWRPELLRLLNGRELPDLEKLPVWFAVQRERNRPGNEAYR